MANQYYPQPQSQSYNPQNLQFYQSSYPQPVSGHTTPSQAQYGYPNAQSHASQAYPSSSGGFGGAPTFGGPGFGGAGVSGRMGEQGGLRTGWLAAFGTEGYDGEPPLLEELGLNFGHITGKLRPAREKKKKKIFFKFKICYGENRMYFAHAITSLSLSPHLL